MPIEQFADALAIAESMAAAAEVDETGEYLTRGRAYKHRSRQWLNEAWVAAFRAWFNSDLPTSYRPVADIRAELSLRGVQPPYDTVRAELEIARSECLAAESPLDDAVQAYLARGRLN